MDCVTVLLDPHSCPRSLIGPSEILVLKTFNIVERFGQIIAGVDL